MASVNKAILLGNLGRDPEVRHLPSGDTVCTFSIATTEKWKDKQGQAQESTEWHNITFSGRLAEVCAQYLRKGSAVYVEGSIHTKKYTGKDGVEKYATSIKGYSMQMLGSKAVGNQSEMDQERPTRSKPAQQPLPGGLDEMQDNIPF